MAGRKLFSEQGFHSTSVADIALLAGTTQGAVYHHFTDKAELFWAVTVEVYEEQLSKMRLGRELLHGDELWDRFRKNISDFLAQMVTEGTFQNIIVADGPAVFGWERWQEIHEKFAVRPVMTALELAMDAQTIRRRPSRPLAVLINSAINGAAVMIAQANSNELTVQEVIGALDELLLGLAKITS